jgi:hypothetical protein
MDESAPNALERVGLFARRPAAALTMGMWAAAEAIVLPIVPDVGLCLLVLAAPRRTLVLLAAVVIGAIAGTLVMAAFALQSPDDARGVLLAIPAIDPALLASADRELARDGVAGFAQFGPGTPLKVYTVEWLALGGDIAGLLVGTVLNRITRIGPALIVAAVIGTLARPWLRRHSSVTLLAYAALWVLVYVAYFTGLARGVTVSGG